MGVAKFAFPLGVLRKRVLVYFLLDRVIRFLFMRFISNKILNLISALNMEGKRCWDIWFELFIRDLVVAIILSSIFELNIEINGW